MPRAAKVVALPAPAPEAPAPEVAVPVATSPDVAAPGAPVTPEGAAVLVPLADLYLSPLNPRQDHDPEGIAALAESLRTLGLLQNLAGLRDGEGRVGIVAGGRRFAALMLAAEGRPDLGLVPVRLAPDEATARLWALAENTARAGLHIADEVRAYRRMAETRTPLPAIASAFAVTEAHVRRRLKLASLPEPILDALKAGQISAGHAQAFTVCADEARQLAILPDVVQRRMSEDSLRRVLTQEQVRADDRRAVFVGLDAYQEAGGTLTRDLFAAGDVEAFLDNPALLERLLVAKLETAAEAKKAEGWRWIDTLPDTYMPWSIGAGMARVYPLPDDLSEEAEEELLTLNDRAEAGEELDDEELARLDELESAQTASTQPEHRAVAGGWLYVDRDGDLCEALGFIRAEDREAAVEAGAIEPPRLPSFGPGGTSTSSSGGAAPAPAKGPYSFALVDDMKAIRLAAVQTALLDHPELVLDLLAFALQPESGYPGRIMAVRPERQRIDPTEAEGFQRDPRFKEGPERYQDRDSLVADFAAFRAHGPEHRNTVLTEAFARTLCYNAGPSGRAAAAALFEEIERESGASVRAVWRPTAANFFGRVSAAYLDDLFKSLLERDDADQGFRTWKAMKKGEKAQAMERIFNAPEGDVWGVTPEQRARIDAWVPDCA